MTYLLIAVGVVGGLYLLRLVLMYGDVHSCARNGWTARLTAMLDRDPALVKALDEEAATPLHRAAAHGALASMRLLLARGADVQAPSKQQATPLHFAAAFGEAEAVRLLLQSGAAVDPKDELGMTPYHVAMGRGHEALAQELVKAGAVEEPPPVIDLGGGHFVSLVAPDDPLMQQAVARARAELGTLRALFAANPGSAAVKFAFATDAGQVEHLWGELLELGERDYRVRVKTLPNSHRGAFEKVQRLPLAELEDWSVELRDGTLRGGFGYQVVFLRTREKLGRLPDELARHEGRYVDHRPFEAPLDKPGA